MHSLGQRASQQAPVGANTYALDPLRRVVRLEKLRRLALTHETTERVFGPWGRTWHDRRLSALSPAFKSREAPSQDPACAPTFCAEAGPPRPEWALPPPSPRVARWSMQARFSYPRPPAYYAWRWAPAQACS